MPEEQVSEKSLQKKSEMFVMTSSNQALLKYYKESSLRSSIWTLYIVTKNTDERIQESLAYLTMRKSSQAEWILFSSYDTIVPSNLLEIPAVLL